MKNAEKTCRQLYDQFCKKFSITQVGDSTELTMIYSYLREKTKTRNGNYIHVPPAAMRKLIKKHTGHEYNIHWDERKNEGPTKAGPSNNNNAEQLIYNLVEGICK